ncbi:hypothetical protein BX265_7146 [Streptomyces sp. TLI_235]|nr:hypothetical protein BX265_7146 [Streptomyces sp. TLI_235]
MSGQHWSQFGEVVHDGIGLLRVDPSDQVVVRRVPVGILQGDLGLADAASRIGLKGGHRGGAADQLFTQSSRTLARPVRDGLRCGPTSR